MPKFSIDNINYIVAGQKEKILNLDITEVSTGKTFKNFSFFTESDTVNLFSIENPQSISPIEARNDVNSGIDMHFATIGDNRNIGEHGFRFLENPDKCVHALFDVKDVALKSKIAKRIEKTSDILEAYNTSSEVDMYFPHLRKNPLGFVQLKEYSYGITDSTPVAPVLKTTSMFKSRIENNISSDINTYSSKPLWNFFLNPYDRYDSKMWDPETLENLIPLYTYTPLENLKQVVSGMLSSEVLDSNELERRTIETASSYAAFRDFICERYDSASMLSVLFQPAYNFQNVEHNYIMELPIDILQLKDNAYWQGTVYGDMIMGKNAYDDLYDMNVSKLGDFKHLRQYQTIQQTGNNLFVNYFDDIEGAGPKNKIYDNTYEKQTEDVKLNSLSCPELSARDYVKVECIDAINRFINLTDHKANLYSTKIYGLNQLLNSHDSTLSASNIKENIKTSIENSIRRIVTNFVPAHTQYFGVVAYEDSCDDCMKTTENC